LALPSWFDILHAEHPTLFPSVFPWSDISSSSVDSSDPPLLSFPSYDLDDATPGSTLEPTVDIVPDPVLLSDSFSVDPTSKYLYALDLHLQETRSDRSTFYHQHAVFSQGPHLLAHMDAGSMASTTNHLDYLLDFHSLQGSTTTLHIADDTPHHPTGVGYLKVPTLGSPGYLLVRTFYTPSLPVTILLPASITSDAGCIGYTSFAKLDGHECCLTLHTASSTSDDITFPLQLQHGLLFTHALH